MRTIFALARKDLRVLSRVKAGVFFTFIWPLIVAILFGLVFAGQSDRKPPPLGLAVVDEDNTEASRTFLARLEASNDFALDRMSLPEADAMVRRGNRAAFVVIKKGFGDASGRMFYGTPREIQIGNDPARQAEASMIEGLLTKHAMTDFQAMFTDAGQTRRMVTNALNGSPPAPLARFLGELTTFLDSPTAQASAASEWQPVEISRTPVARERIGPDNPFEITFPQGIMWGIIGCVMSFAIGLVSERVRGTFMRLQTAPISRIQILAGKALGCFIALSLLQLALIAIAVVAFDVSVSSYPLLALACVCASLGFVGFMMMVAGLGRTEQAASGAGWAMLMPMTLFGGGMMPQFIMPSWMQTIGNASPVKWTIRGIEGAVWRDFTLGEMLLPCAVLLIFGAACFAIGVRGLRD
jgi:ABC-2 type transport system permease protein